MALILGASSASAQEATEPPASDVNAAVAAALFDSVVQSFDASLDPIRQVEAAAGDDDDVRRQAYSEYAFWALMYANAVEGLDFPAEVQPLADDFVIAHRDYSEAAEARALAENPSLAALREAYFEAFMARQASISALRDALGLPPAGVPVATEAPSSSPSPSP